jgi:ribosome biogenesis GTPase
LHPFLGHCKFRNCQHRSEPGCALLQALQDNKISSDRWDSYQEMLLNMSKN